MISGETGTGKEVCARAIHYLNARSTMPFIAVNCGAAPAELAENKLFGHERGAYTNTDNSHRRVIAEAEGARCSSMRLTVCPAFERAVALTDNVILGVEDGLLSIPTDTSRVVSGYEGTRGGAV